MSRGGRRFAPRVLTGVIAAGALLVGAAVGSTGASLATWKDSESRTTTAINWGYEYFAVGLPGATSSVLGPPTLVSGPVTTVLSVNGVNLATQVLGAGKGSQAFQVDGISQGNMGMRYTVAWQGTWGAGTPLADPGVTLAFFPVANAAACTPDAVAPPAPVQPIELVSSDYSTSTAITSQFWCLTAKGTMSDAGTYTNEATATAQAGGSTINATPTGKGNTWSAQIKTTLTAASQGSRHLRFTYTTFRPGA